MSEFVEYLNEVFVEFGAIQSKRMFGGYGIYREGVMFALVSDDTLYLKADETTAKYFEEKGLEKFEYDKSGKKIKLSYYRAPEEILDDLSEAKVWAERAFAVALM